MSSSRTVQLTPAASARRAIALSAGKATRAGVRRLGRRHGIALPGRVTLAIDPGALAGLVAEIARGTVIITGSSGKSTTCRMLAQIVRAAGWRPVLNRESTSRRPGLATTMVAHAGPAGHLPPDPRAIGLFEVHQRSLPEILRQVSRPSAVVVTNIFRGQPGGPIEPASLRGLTERAMRTLPAETRLVLNADDPMVACLAPELPNPRLYFGMSDSVLRKDGSDPAADFPGCFPACPRCGGELAYECVFYAHLGHWACTACGLARPQPDVSITKIDPVGPSSTRLQVVTSAADTVLEIPLQGLCNAYNALAAVTVAVHNQLPDWSFAAMDKITAGPSRMERVRVAGHDVHLALADNANRYSEVLRAVPGDNVPKRMLLGLSSGHGKQPDTSWIWDVDFSALAGFAPAPVLSGNRAAELAVRLKYAGWLAAGQDGASGHDIVIEPDPVRAFRAAIAAAPPGQPLWVVSTAAVLWKIRRWLRQQGYVREQP